MPDTIKEVRKHSRRMWAAIIILFVFIFANFGYAFANPGRTTQTIIGPVGPVGPSGKQGERGPAGKDGQDGQPGPQGIPGIQGIQGLMGPPGSNGLNGADGLNGSNGTNGVNGPPPDLRGNDENHSIEWRVAGDPDWHVLVYYCQLTNTCVPAETAD